MTKSKKLLLASAASAKTMIYTAPDGKTYPLEEAQYDMAFKVYKNDRRRAIIGDPRQCLLALGAMKSIPDALEVYIGSGLDAYVVFEARGSTPATARHFTIPTQASKVRDAFETAGSPDTQIIMLRAPTKARTLAARAKLNKDRNVRIKNGTHIVKPRGTPKKKRIMTLGIAHRERARISKSGVDTQPVAA